VLSQACYQYYFKTTVFEQENIAFFAQASACLTGKTKRAKGHRLFLRRPDHVYPSAEAANDNHASTLSAKKAVVLLDGSGKVLKEFASQSEAGVALGLSPVVVSNAVRSGRVAKEFGCEKECLACLGISPSTVTQREMHHHAIAVPCFVFA